MIDNATIDLESFTKTIQGIEDKTRDLTPFLAPATIFSVGKVQDRFSTGVAPDGTIWKPLLFRRPNGGNRPLLDKGLLRASFTGSYAGNSLSVGTVMPQANLMNFGGVVRPVRSKFLAIPATKEAKRVGSPRNFPEKLSPRIGKAGQTGVLLQPIFDPQSGAKVGDVVQYYLTKIVTIPARPFIGWSDEDLEILEEMLKSYLLS